jgi:hypothetical protein
VVLDLIVLAIGYFLPFVSSFTKRDCLVRK